MILLSQQRQQLVSIGPFERKPTLDQRRYAHTGFPGPALRSEVATIVLFLALLHVRSSEGVSDERQST
jgi:hypothetical protein